MTTYAEASAIMYGIAQAVLDTQGTAICGYVPESERMGYASKKRKANQIWVRGSRRNVIEGQQSLGQDASGEKHYRTQGVLTIQVFAPKTDPRDYDRAETLAAAIRDAYRRTGGEVCFEYETMREAPVGNKYYQFNVTVEYDYEDNT